MDVLPRPDGTRPLLALAFSSAQAAVTARDVKEIAFSHPEVRLRDVILADGVARCKSRGHGAMQLKTLNPAPFALPRLRCFRHWKIACSWPSEWIASRIDGVPDRSALRRALHRRCGNARNRIRFDPRAVCVTWGLKPTSNDAWRPPSSF